MIQTAVRALTLNIYNVSDNMVYDFITTPPVSKYFTDIVHSMKEQCVHLDSLVHTAEKMSTSQRRKTLLLETDKVVDDLYYFKDILCVDDSRLSKMIYQNLLHLLILPILFSLLQLRQSDGSTLSAITSIYVVSRVLQVVGGKDFTKSVARVVLHPYMSLSMKDAGEGDTDISFFNNLGDMEKVICSDSWPAKEGIINGNTLHGHLPLCQLINSPIDDNLCPERIGMLALILSDNPSLLLAALFLLLTLLESKDLEHALATVVGPVTMQHGLKWDTSDSHAAGQSILVKYMPQVLNALLKVLASKLPISVLIQWHTGWFLRKLLAFPGNKLDEYNIHLFNNSYKQSCECFQKELEGCWFDYVLDTLRGEWASCTTALEEPSQSKDPFFLLELVGTQQFVDGDATSSYFAWQTMVDAVKVFILHLQLKAFICTGKLLEKPLLHVMSSIPTASGRTHASDLSSASFGSEVSLGSGIPCRIAFSNAGTRDIYLIPVARVTYGKLLLVEKHPFRSQRGVVIAIAPLAGLSPRIDEDHPTWLHLRIREFDPSFAAKKGYKSKAANYAADGRWTIGFSNAEACEAARLVILQETTMQRSSVRSVLAPLLENNFLGNLSDGQNEGDAPTQGV
uniref:Uncharacterized protein LOC105635829 isoform X2 n=4 Tax=Rhizophora mucronata TaxID=61149 RepID=A0A2P2L4V1_RHIMU